MYYACKYQRGQTIDAHSLMSSGNSSGKPTATEGDDLYSLHDVMTHSVKWLTRAPSRVLSAHASQPWQHYSDHNTTSGQHPHNNNNINSDVSVCFQLSINLRDPSAAQEAHDVILEARSVLVTDWSIRASGKEEQGRRWSFRFMTELSWKPWRTSDHPTLSNSKNKCTINIF